MDATDPSDVNSEACLFYVLGWTILMLHVVEATPKIHPAAAKLVQEHAPDIGNFEHSHQVCTVQHDGILYVNPGSAGALCCHGCCTRGCCRSSTCTCKCCIIPAAAAVLLVTGAYISLDLYLASLFRYVWSCMS